MRSPSSAIWWWRLSPTTARPPPTSSSVIGRGEDVDFCEEASQRVSHLTQTAARFLLFWDNIATLLAEDPDGPLTFPPPEPCADGEMQTFELPLQSVGAPALQSRVETKG